jgi:hypothetical protein
VIVQKTELAGNLRGIVTHDLGATIIDSTIRNHERAGVFLDQAMRVVIERNTIADNGASGIFINSKSEPPYYGIPSSVSITHNVIRDNREWGIARTRHGIVGVTENSIVGNRLYAIDVDLDLDHPSVETPSLAPVAPVIVSATWDPVRMKTIVRFGVPANANQGGRIDIFASSALSPDGYPQAEQFLAAGWPGQPSAEVEMEVEGDHRGKWITATTTRWYPGDWPFPLFDTSEVSNAVRVE